MISKSPDAPIGVFDSGLGGLTVLKSCLQAMPTERFVYLGDTARTPYGSKAHETICRYGVDCADFLASHDVKFLVVACNTVSAHAMPDLEARFDCPIVGTVDPAVRAALRSTRNRRVGVIGTEATINRGAYQEALKLADPAVEVVSQACPLFVPLVEQGMVSGEIVEKVVELYLAGLKESGVDSVILGCTHYPLLSEAIRAYLGEDVSLVACSDAVAASVVEILAEKDLGARESRAGVEYFVTDAADRFDSLGRALLGLDDVHSRHIDL
ncbi:MAG: glutamate racemase [Armatimonadetes bacterium]|nr:glutamate racemase [Armatimonadota bacterium]